jgi:S1-C subfamily serine protease
MVGPCLTAAVTGGTPLGPNSRADIILNGSGFFIKGHFIVTTASTVLLPPSLTSVVNRYPFLDPMDTTLGTIRNEMVRASRILVSVFNVNNKGHSFVYEADLIGVDGAGDIALLRINFKRQWNLCNPCIEKCHPYFKLGSSRATKDGEKAYLIGDFIANALNPRTFSSIGIIDGLVADHRYTDYSGFILPESVLVSASVYSYKHGLPILNCQAQVIGMQTSNVVGTVPQIRNRSTPVPTFLTQLSGLGGVGGPSEFFMRRVLKEFIKGSCTRKFNCNLEIIQDPAGSYYRYKKGYLGVAYNLLIGPDYDVTVDFTSGQVISGLPRVRLSPNGDFLNSPSCKELIGIRVIGLAGLNPDDAPGVPNGATYVPGGVGVNPVLAQGLPVSPLLCKLQPGDVITHIEGVALGDLDKQIAPSLITWRLCAGDQIEICYRRGGNALNTADNSLTENYDNLYTQCVTVADFPRLMDYPWYAVDNFPLLADFPYLFVFPDSQSPNPQFPSLNPLFGFPPFHPAF